MRFTLLLLLWSLSAPAQQTFTVFDRNNSPLPDNQCRYIAVDSLNRKWFCTEYGLAVFDDVNWSVYQTTNSGLTDNSVKHVTFDQLGRAWISTQNGGVCVFDGTNWTSYTTANSPIAADYIRSVTIDRFGNAWICTIAGLNRFDGANWTTWNIGNSNIPVDHISRCVIENDTLRWLGTVNGGFSRMVRDTGFTTWDYMHQNFPDNSMTDVVLGPLNHIWMTCPAGALVNFVNGSWFTYNTLSSGIPTNSLNSLQFDSLDNLWLGTYDRGIVKKEGPLYYSWYTANSGMPDDNVFYSCVEGNGIVWAGTEQSGVVRFDENLWLGPKPVAEPSRFTIYPNPARDHALLRFDQAGADRIQLLNTQGQLMRELGATTAGTIRLDLTGIPAGCYILSITAAGRVEQRRLMVL
jgi:ligand-binding sensor domain-containing protein